MQPITVFVAVLSLMIPLGQCITTLTVGPIAPSLPTDPAKMARYILWQSAWISVGTISTQDGIQSYPFVSTKSVSDGPPYNSTGIPYLYVTEMDVSTIDIKANNRSTLSASLAQSDVCKQNNWDPQNPQCPRLMLTGRILKVDENTPEHEFAKNAMFSKHPEMACWPSGHTFHLAKLHIERIEVLYKFGPIINVPLKDYFAANPVCMIDSNDDLNSHYYYYSTVVD